jgi:hypothetical protein
MSIGRALFCGAGFRGRIILWGWFKGAHHFVGLI